MIDHRPDRLPARPPNVSAPAAFTERRVAFRRAEDRTAHQEKVLLARALDVLASEISPEERLAGLLRLLARTVGARRAAVVADGIERRAAVAIDPDEDPAMAEALAAWLDVHAPRSRARRAAAGRAPISFIVAAPLGVRDAGEARYLAVDPSGAASRGLMPTAEAGETRSAPPAEFDRPGVPPPDERPNAPAETPALHYALLPIPSAGDVALGFEFRRASDADHIADRLPPTMARHAAVALALVTSQLATERELAALRARDAERTTFVSTVAHELRTPLTGLRGYLELILGGQVGDPVVERDFLERSRSIVGSMGELVGDLLELSRLESGTLGLEIGPFSLAEACSQVAGGLLPIAIEHGIRLTATLPPRLRVARGDRRRVEQVLTNLAANALKFTPAGGSVGIDARFDGPVAIVAIRDDGSGIPDEDRERIFERFHRMAGHERITGTGLGLPIARDLARRMDGELDVASVAGTGSSFVLALPGPTEVAAGVLLAALDRALVREREALEGAAIRGALVAGMTRAAGSDGAAAGERPDRLAADDRDDELGGKLGGERDGDPDDKPAPGRTDQPRSDDDAPGRPRRRPGTSRLRILPGVLEETPAPS